MTSGTSVNTASVSFTAGRLYVFFVHSNVTGAADPTVTSSSNTWVKVVSKQWDQGAQLNRNLSAWRCVSPTTVSEAITINPGGSANVGYGLIEIASGFDNASNGASAIGTSTTGNSESLQTSGSLGTLSLAGSDSIVLAGWSHRVAEVTSPGSGWTELTDNNSGTGTQSLETQYKLNGTTPGASWATSAKWGGIAVEVKASSPNISIDAEIATATSAIPSSGNVPEVDVNLTYTIPD